MKRIVCILIILCIALSFTACQSTLDEASQSADKPAENTTKPPEKTEETTSLDIPDDDYIPDSEFTDAELEMASYWVDYRNQGKTFTLAKRIVAGDTSIPEGDTVDDNDWIRVFKLTHGVEPIVEWWASGDAYDQKVSMSIASDDIPDYLEVNINQFRMLAKAGMLADLTPYYETAMPPIRRKPFKEAEDRPLKVVTHNEKILGYPSLQPGGDSGSLVWLRTDWLENLGLDEPKTYDDVGRIALAFATQDPDGNGIDDTTGLIISGKENGHSASSADIGNTGEMFIYYGAYPKMWIKGDDAKVQYGSIMPGAADCLAVLNDWYKKGAIYKEFTSLGDEAWKPISAGQCGIFFCPWWASWSLADSVVNDPSGVWKSYGIPREDSNFYVGMVDPAQTIGVISSKAEDPEMIWRLLVVGRPAATIRNKKEKAAIEEARNKAIESGLAHSYQPFRVIVANTIFTVENNYKRIWGLKNGTMTWDDIKEYYDENGLTFSDSDYDVSVVKAYLNVLERENPYEVIGEWANGFGYGVGIAPMAQDNCVRIYNDFIGLTPTMETKGTYLNKLESESYIKMILGDTDGLSVRDYFDKFVDEWKKQGGEQITLEVEAELDSAGN